MNNKNLKIYIAGHKGMVGSSCWRTLSNQGFKNLLGKSSKELDLKDYESVLSFLKLEKPDIIIDAAAKVGGILANDSYPYDFLIENMLIQNNLIRGAHETNIKKFIFLGSSCIYPKMALQPLKEEYLLSGLLEETNQWYAIAKISGVKLIEALRIQHNRNYVSLMPTNLYGPNDNFGLKSSHVLPAMIRKFDEAKKNNHSKVVLWGSGTPMREFLHVDDLSQAVLFAINNNLQQNLYNIGTGKDITINKLALVIQNIVGHKGDIIWDSSKPDGTPRKLLDISKIKKEGWVSKIDLHEGVRQTYNWYLENLSSIRSID
jgi:GDP-L-fucose synthase